MLSLSRYLKSARDINALELSKIWKALFYCFWHSDKPKVQRDLAEKLSALVHSMPQAKAMAFARAFWDTMAREWHGIDRIRCVSRLSSLTRVRISPQQSRLSRTLFHSLPTPPASHQTHVVTTPTSPTPHPASHPSSPVALQARQVLHADETVRRRVLCLGAASGLGLGTCARGRRRPK